MATSKRPTTAKTSKKTASKKTAVAKAKKATAAKRKSVSKAPVQISAEERWRMIAVAAYHKAEKRDFAPGHDTDDWLEAEREVDALIGTR
jgi:hypothetical protein